MAPRPVPFQKFKDPAVKKPIHRFKNNNHNDKTKFNYAQKLANSIKRRALTSSKKSPNKVTKRKLNFQTLPKPKMLELPKPTFYGNKKKENDNIEDGEIIEEIMSSDDDDCIVLEPIVHKIEIKDDDDGNGNALPNNDIPTSSSFIIDKKREPELAWNKQKSNDDDGNGSDLPNNEIPTSSSFIIDKKRDPQLAWNKQKSKADKGLFYIKKTAVIIDSITIDDSFDQAYRVDSPVKIVDDRKPIAIEKEPSNDESVIIVEDCDEDFIPLPADDNADKLKPKRAKGYVDPKVQSTPKRIRERMNDSLFTTTERKKLADYNSNTYNPGTTEGDAPVTHKRPIIIDGSNVAFGHGCSNTFSAEGIKYCVDYFEKMGHDVKAVIPLYRRNPHKSSNPALLEQLYKDNKLVCTPCKNLPNQQSISYDDRFILQIAYERNAAVVSNDNYRDLIHENPAFKKIIENRVIGYSWCDNILILPKDPYGRFGPPLSEILRC